MLQKLTTSTPYRDRLIESERLMDETGCYDGITELTLRKQDPLKFETRACHIKQPDAGLSH
jgi:acetone carboxylase alpha subunit